MARHRIAALAGAVAVAGLGGGQARAAGVEGLVYDTGTAARVAGVTAELFYDETDPLAPGARVPEQLLGDRQQGQTVGDDGRYRFDVQPGRRYRIALGVDRTPFSFPSTVSAPAPGLTGAGAVSPSPAPPELGAPARYFLRFDVAGASDEITNNHIPVDRLAVAVELTKTASRARAEVGDVVTYRIVATNRSDRPLGTADRELFVRDAPPRGFDLVDGSARARLVSDPSGQAAPVAVDRSAGVNRLLRFGPLSLPAGGRLVLEYRMVVGADTRPGKSTNLAVLVDPGGVELSSRAAAAVEVARPRGLESSVILGRVFCDVDGDRQLDRGEPGVFGARVYLDTGSYAVSDTGGLFHFTRVDAGTRLLKLDAGSLASSAIRGSARRQLQITEGLGAEVAFPIDCKRVEVAGRDARVTIRHRRRPRAGQPPKAPRLTVSAELALLKLTVDDADVALPTATLKLATPAAIRLESARGVDLAAPPSGGYAADRPVFELGWSGVSGSAARRWRFSIDAVDAGGATTPVLRRSGAGAPPATIAWDGRGDGGQVVEAGRLYVAQLAVTGAPRKVEAESVRLAFGVEHGRRAAAPIAETWTGALFSGSRTRPAATAELTRKIDALAAQLEPGDRIRVRVHGGGLAPSLDAIAATQRRAALIETMLIDRGVDPKAISARGRGNAELAVDPPTRTSIAKNRRVVIEVKRAGGSEPDREVPELLPGPASARIDGQPVAVDDRGRVRWQGALPARGAVQIDLRAHDGRRAALEVPLTGRFEQPADDEPVAPAFDRPTVDLPADPHVDDPLRPTFSPPARRPVSEAELLASAAADFSVTLPPAGAVLGLREVAVRGRARPGNRLSINGVAVELDAAGRFAALIGLEADARELVVKSADAAGFVAELRWPLSVDSTRLFAMALGEIAVSTSITSRGLFADTAYLPGMTPDTTAAVGPLLLHGRAAMYLKGELEAGDFFGRVELTAHVDTARRKGDRGFFEDTHDAASDPPVLGDSALEVRDANGRGKVYAQIKARGSEAVVGALAVELGSARLFRYGRTVDGAGVALREDLGEHRVELDAFGTAATTELRRDHVWYRSTGGTIYHLRFARVVEGSELLRQVVLERDSGQPIRERVLRRNVDYTIDYDSGRVWMLAPLPHAETSPWILDNSDAAITPADGDPVYLEARYEHRDTTGGPGDRAAGVEARYRLGSLVRAGAGIASEVRDGAADYRLWGAHARIAPGERSAITLEVAGSERREGALELSVDGGLTFRDLDAGLDPGDAGDHQAAWRIGGDLFGGDLTGAPILSGSRLRFYAQGIDSGFSSTSTGLERGAVKFGAAASAPIGDRDTVVFRHQGSIADVGRLGPSAADVVADPGPVDERAAYLTSAQWRGRRGPVTHTLELGHQRLSSTAADAGGAEVLDARRVGGGGRISYALTPRLSAELTQQLWLSTRRIDPLLEPAAGETDPLAGVTTGAGVSWQVLEDAALVAGVEQRWNGDRAASLGLAARLSELGSFYVAERARTGVAGPAAVTVIGAEDRFGADGKGRSYGEYQIESSHLGVRNRAVLGLGRRWRIHPAAAVGLAFEHQLTTGGVLPDGTPVGENQRDLVRAGLDLRHGDALVAGMLAEVRRDRGLGGGDVDAAIVESDPRLSGAAGFADHGGVAPGAPLILPAGEATQLVGSAGLTWRAAEGTSLFGRARGAVTYRDGETEPAVERPGFGELTGGLAFRSLVEDRLAVLLRYSYVVDRRPDPAGVELAAAAGDAESRSHILAMVPVARLPFRIGLSGKLAWKRSRELGGLAGAARADSVLALARLGYRIAGGFDAAVEGRTLWVERDGARELRAGTLAEVGYWLSPFARFGLGYNFSRFDDNELGDLTRDAHGLFFRVTGEM